ncbi:MAG: hypothetical protein ACE5JS_13945 [Nitrospinota bacterium]
MEGWRGRSTGRRQAHPTNDPNGPFGAKGCAGCALDACGAAIANAAYDAVGVRVKDLPVTPQKVLRGLRERGEFAQT